MLHFSGDLNQKSNHKISSNVVGGEKVWLKIWYATWTLMRKLRNTKQSTKVNTTISVLQDAKKPSKQTHKNTSVVTRQVKVAIAVTTNAKQLRFSHCVLLFVSYFQINLNS
jgi:hypothetical protein